MKKIGLVTFHESDNYGTNLQAYALQQAVIKLGYDIEIIDFKRKILQKEKSNKSFYLTFIKNIIKKFPKSILNYFRLKSLLEKNSFLYKKFRLSYFTYSKPIDIESIAYLDELYCKFICGSDMIWSADRSSEIEFYLLDFASDEKKIAYAPSFGSTMIPIDLVPKYAKSLKSFPFLSCREKSGVELIENLIKVKVPTVVDPTLLFSNDWWLKKCIQINNNSFQGKKYCLSYVFGGLNKNSRLVNSFSTIEFYEKHAHISIPRNYTDLNYKYLKEGIGPLEFLTLFASAEFIITNSYHGLIFSLIFKKPFCVVSRTILEKESNYETRIISLLDKIDESFRYVSVDDYFNPNFLTIDYSKIDKILSKEIDQSWNYLINAIKCC